MMFDLMLIYGIEMMGKMSFYNFCLSESFGSVKSSDLYLRVSTPNCKLGTVRINLENKVRYKLSKHVCHGRFFRRKPLESSHLCRHRLHFCFSRVSIIGSQLSSG